MKVAIRADASVEIGSGHVMRCLALADALREGGAEVLFLMGQGPGDMGDFVAGRRYAVERLALESWSVQGDGEASRRILSRRGGVDWLVVDHYALGRDWEWRQQGVAERLLVIDDLANRPHQCDLLLDQNCFPGEGGRYDGRIPDFCHRLLGPSFALLRPEFAVARAGLRRRAGKVARLLISFGGSDPSGETIKALNAVLALGRPEWTVDVVVGAAHPRRREVEALCAARVGIRFLCQADNMAELMAEADLGLGAAGSSMWERCCLGLPTLTAIVAPNQESLLPWARAGLFHVVGGTGGATVEQYRAALEGLTAGELSAMSAAGLETVDGQGTARVIAAMDTISRGAARP